MNLSSQPIPRRIRLAPARDGSAACDPCPTAASAPFDNGSALAVARVAWRVAGRRLSIVDAIREAVLQAMETGGSQMLVHALEEGHWSGAGRPGFDSGWDVGCA